MNNISEFDSDLNIISKLSDQPNTTDGLSPSALKAKFDLAGNTVKGFINGTLVTAVNALIGLAHSHANKDALDAVTAVTVSNAHTHSNKALLDTYTQTEANLASAVSGRHTHSNKALLDAYSQTEANLASAVSNTHTHSNKALLDAISAAPVLTNASQDISGHKTFWGDVTMAERLLVWGGNLYGTDWPSNPAAGQIFFKRV
jgi:hypothetical protein